MHKNCLLFNPARKYFHPLIHAFIKLYLLCNKLIQNSLLKWEWNYITMSYTFNRLISDNERYYVSNHWFCLISMYNEFPFSYCYLLSGWFCQTYLSFYICTNFSTPMFAQRYLHFIWQRFIVIMTGSKGEDILTHFLQSSLCLYVDENSCKTHDQFSYNVNPEVYGTFKLAQKGFLT